MSLTHGLFLLVCILIMYLYFGVQAVCIGLFL